MKNPEFVSDVVRMYQSGINQKEIVEILGISYCQCRYWLKKKGLYDPSRRQRNTCQAHQKHNEQLRQKTESRLALELLAQGFIYVSGYINRASECVIFHPVCGRSFERVPRWFSGECPLCKQDKIDAKKTQKQAKTDEWKRKAEEQREAKQKQAELKEYHRLYDAHVCAWCNKIFTIKEYEEREGKSNVNKLTHCSSACIEAHNKTYRKQCSKDTHSKHRLRAKKYGVGFERGISLQALVRRDGLNCALCGKLCNWNDIKQGCCGPTYPSIDHIIPMSKGGAHSWNNVQVAHRSCNTMKGTKTNWFYAPISPQG